MTDKRQIEFSVVKTTTIGFISLLFSSMPAFAQTTILSPDTEETAYEIGNIIISNDLVTESISTTSELDFSGKSPTDIVRELLHHAHGVATVSNSLNPTEIIELYEKAVLEHGNTRDKSVYELYKLYLTTVDLSNTQKSVYPELENALELHTENEDWFIANTAWRLLAVLNSQTASDNLPLALEQAQSAYKIIPNEVSPYVDDARVLTLEQTTFLHNLLLNPKLAIENTAELIKQKQISNYPVDGSSLLNNLIYSLSEWREYDVSTKLAKDVLQLEEKFGSNVPGLTELRVGRLLNKQGKFSEALPLIENGLSNAQRHVVRKNLALAHITALAGLGRKAEADRALKSVIAQYYNGSEAINDKNLNAAKAAIAIANGHQSEIFRLTTEVNDLTAQSLLRRYSNNTSELLASLENTKERQAEREAGLKREAVLKQAELDQQKQRNRLLIVIASLLAFAAGFAILFARYRNRVSKELEIKTAEAEDADRMKSEFLGMVSHELRTPLNGIVGIADLLSMTAPTDDMRYKAGIILDSSNKLTHVVESIVDMSRIDGEKLELYPEAVNVHSMVTELDKSWRPVIEGKGVTFTSYVENSLIDDIILDKARFHQCLNSLLSNAAKFTDRGRVHLHVTSQPSDIDNQVEITAIIADTGQGMSEEVQGKLFTPFLQADSSMTRKHGGSGLGLAITQSLARMMNGDVTMISKQGRGSEFTLTVKGPKSETAEILDEVEFLLDNADMLPTEAEVIDTPDVQVQQSAPDIQPVAAEYAPIQAVDHIDNLEEKTALPVSQAPAQTQTPQQGSVSAYDAESLRGLNILIVEDIQANQDVIKLFLDPEGCKSYGAQNGHEAIEMLESQAFDIILMDIRMPDMDGIEATRIIRSSGREYQNTPIIALTADVAPETNAACMSAGADIFLTKPVMGRDLIESIKFIRRFHDYEDDTASDVA